MARLHGHVVRAPVIQNSRRELVARKCLRLVRQRNGILAVEILLRLAVDEAIDGHVDGNLVPLHQVHLEEDELRRAGRELELVPVGGSGARGRRAPRRTGKRHVVLVVARCEHRLAERNLHRVLPAPRRRALDQPRTRPSVHVKRIVPGSVRRTHHHRRRTRLRDAELRVVVRVSRVQRLGCQDGVPLSNFYFHACVPAKAGQRGQ